MKENYIAIDLGASNGRVILGALTDEKFELQELHRFANDPIILNGRMYWDTFGLFREICKGLCIAGEVTGGAAAGIGIDTWGVDFGLLDSNGELVGMPLHYRDTQTAGMMEEAFKTCPKEDIFRETGLAFLELNSLYQLLALQKRNAGALRVAEKLLFMPDLFGWMLTGKSVTEYTIASTGQLLHTDSRKWSEKIIEAFNLPRGLFGDICEPGTMLGYLKEDIAEATGLQNVPVFSVAGHDTASAVAAVPAKDKHFAYISSGTWSLIGIESDTPHMEDTVREMNFTNEGGVWGSFRILKNVCGLWIIQECRRYWQSKGLDYSYGQLADMAATAKPFAAVIDPDDDLFFHPGRMPEKVMTYCKERGMPIQEDPGSIIRVVLESLALRYRWCMDALEKICGAPLDCLHIVGGGCQNTLLNQLTANAIGRPVICGPVEATAIGNLLMQAVGSGRITSSAQARSISAHTEALRRVWPETADRAAWNSAYAQFLRLIG